MRTVLLALALLALAHLGIGIGQAAEALPLKSGHVFWRTDYGEAMDEARLARKMAFVWFYDPKWANEDEQFVDLVLHKPEIAERIAKDCVPVKLPIDARSLVSGEEVTLLDHASFSELLHKPGIAIIDQTDEKSPHYGHVVSVFPFTGRYITKSQLAVMLDLPKGTLSQRTLIWAVRSHPEQPASASTAVFPVLAEETEKHSIHQASMTLQGHHNWGSRFHSINARLPGGLASREVCAESWPGQNLVEAAEECVHSWRQSSGHWDAVSRQHVYYSYDMKKGRNGVWYATGIFAQ
jgi:hypothetical protein